MIDIEWHFATVQYWYNQGVQKMNVFDAFPMDRLIPECLSGC